MSKHHHDEGVDEAKRRARQSSKQIEAGGRFKPGERTYRVRIVHTPADKERNSPAVYAEYLVHNNIGPGHRFGRCGNAPGKTGRCWVCKKRDKLEKQGRTKEAAKLNPNTNIAVHVMVWEPETEDWNGPLLWETSQGKSAKAMGYKLLRLISNEKRNYVDNKRGYAFEFTRKGTGKNTEWGDLDPDDEPTEVPKQILKKLVPFVDNPNFSKYSEQWLKDSYYGKEQSKGEDDMAKRKGKRHDEDEDEVDSSDVTSDSSDEEESSDVESSDSSDASDKKKKKKKKKSKKDSSDESDSSDVSSDTEDDDDDEEEEDSSDKSSDDEDDDDDDDEDSSDKSSDSSDDEDDDDDKKKKKKKKKSKKDSSDDEDEDDDDEEEEESSDSSDKSSDDEDDEEEEEEESSDSSDTSSDDEDEKPKKKKGKRTRKPRSDKGQKRGTRKKKRSRR